MWRILLLLILTGLTAGLYTIAPLGMPRFEDMENDAGNIAMSMCRGEYIRVGGYAWSTSIYQHGLIRWESGKPSNYLDRQERVQAMQHRISNAARRLRHSSESWTQGRRRAVEVMLAADRCDAANGYPSINRVMLAQGICTRIVGSPPSGSVDAAPYVQTFNRCIKQQWRSHGWGIRPPFSPNNYNAAGRPL